MTQHCYGNEFRGNLTLAANLAPLSRGSVARTVRIRELRASLARRVYALAEAGREMEAELLERRIFSITHCGLPVDY